jgi:hypothetical protein
MVPQIAIEISQIVADLDLLSKIIALRESGKNRNGETSAFEVSPSCEIPQSRQGRKKIAHRFRDRPAFEMFFRKNLPQIGLPHFRGKTGSGVQTSNLASFSFPDAPVASPAKFEICTPDPNVATPLLLKTQQVQDMYFSMIQVGPDFRLRLTGVGCANFTFGQRWY